MICMIMFVEFRLAAETSDHFVVFDTIRSSICFQKPVADGWTKVRKEGGE